MTIHFRRQPYTARFLSPDGAELTTRHGEVRFDPLLGTTARIAEGVRLPAAEAEALGPIKAADPACPFCPANLERVTPRIPPDIVPAGRVEAGSTVLFPNLVPYAQYAAVAVFGPAHYLALADFTPPLLASNLAATIAYARAVYATDPAARYFAYNINYLYPSGGSLPHPHAQVYLDRQPTTIMRLHYAAADTYHAEHGRPFWEDLVEAEVEHSERLVGRAGSTVWLTAFAPLGFNEVRAVVTGKATVCDLTEGEIEALAGGIAQVLAWYDASGYNSFNLALYSGPLDGSESYRLNLSLVTRSALLPYYRSDAMYLERLHWEAAVDRYPEDLATEARGYFPSR